VATISRMPPRNPERPDVTVQPEPLQLSAEPMRTWVNDGKGGRVRPVMCVVVGRETGLCYAMDIGKPREPAFELAGRVLAGTLKAARVPEHVRVQVRDPELATALGRRIDLATVNFKVVDRLDAVDAMMAHMERDLFPSRVESPLDQPGMSVKRLAAFADAGVAFYASRPWRHLHDDDVIEVEQPEAPPGLRFASILGAGGQVMGIGFYKDARGYDRLLNAADRQKTLTRTPRWSLMFHAPDELPPEDAELWETHGLRVTADESAPLLLRYRGASQADRPDGKTLTFAEGLCRAIVATSEAEIDSGRWEKTVRTFDGDVTYRLAIPHLLKPASAEINLESGPAMLERSMRQVTKMIHQSGARTPEEINAFLAANVNRKVLPGDAAPAADPRERALDLCAAARGQRSRREFQLLREALRLDPDCADAYVQLAQRESDPVEAEKLYRRGVEAGRRALGEGPFNDPEYPFWGATESRPFMRALSGLAESLEAQDRLEDAAEVLGQMLRLNPGDNQGVRYRYVPLLIELGRLDDARAVLESKEYREDSSALWEFAAALVAFKQRRAAEAEALVRRAAGQNPFVVPMLLNPDDVPPMGPTWSPGEPSEAIMVSDLLGAAWHADAAALRWLESTVVKPPVTSRKPKRKRRT
jgi:tetratricopeptide (TPR) repeat protein